MITLKLKRRDCFAVSLFGKKHWMKNIYSEQDTNRMSRPGKGYKGTYTPIAYMWMIEPMTMIWKCPNETHLAIVMDYVLSSDRFGGVQQPQLDSRDSGHRGAILAYGIDHVVDLEVAVREALRNHVDELTMMKYLKDVRDREIQIPERPADK